MAVFDQEHQTRQGGEGLGQAGIGERVPNAPPHGFRAYQATTPQAAEVIGHVAARQPQPVGHVSRECWPFDQGEE